MSLKVAAFCNAWQGIVNESLGVWSTFEGIARLPFSCCRQFVADQKEGFSIFESALKQKERVTRGSQEREHRCGLPAQSTTIVRPAPPILFSTRRPRHSQSRGCVCRSFAARLVKCRIVAMSADMMTGGRDKGATKSTGFVPLRMTCFMRVTNAALCERSKPSASKVALDVTGTSSGVRRSISEVRNASSIYSPRPRGS